MKPSEAAKVLAYIAAFNGRTVGKTDAMAWADALHPEITLADARTAVAEHFAETTDWCMPAHINRRVKNLWSRRLEAVGIYGHLPATLAPDSLRDDPYGRQTWVLAYRRCLQAGYTEADADAQACTEAGTTRAPDDPLRSLNWHREQQLQIGA